MISPLLKTHLPRWTQDRLLGESICAWNVYHADNKIDYGLIPLAKLQNAVLAFLRHSCSNYDAVLTEENRDALRQEIYQAARHAYPWLFAPDKDAGIQLQRPTPKKLKLLEGASSMLANLYTWRSQLVTKIAHTKEAGPKGELQKKLQSIDARINEYQAHFEVHGDGFRFLRWTHRPGHLEYSFCCHPLASNYIESLRFKCPQCRSTVMRTKRPMDAGCGIRLTAISCLCRSWATDPAHSYCDLALWTEFCQEAPEPTVEEELH